MADAITLTNAALDETPNGDIILRGVIDPESLHLLEIPSYQREILPLASLNSLIRAFDSGTVPDIELGMRGEEFTNEEEGVYNLLNAVFIIDGLQRVSAARRKLEIDPTGKSPHLGAVVHFGTTEKWERERFKILNVDRTRLSPNILLRNWREDFPVMELLFQLSADRGFILHGRVCWNQRMARNELITATTYAKVITRIHGHLGGVQTSEVTALPPALQRVHDNVGKNNLRANVKTFFDVIDNSWGVKRIAFKGGAPYMKGTFLLALAKLFSNHEDFWRGNRLFVEAPLVRKLAGFEVYDPHVVHLASSSGSAIDMLYLMLVEHINSGRRTRRLKPRTVVLVDNDDENSDGEESEAAVAD